MDGFKQKYFGEAGIRLRRAGYEVEPEYAGLLPVEKDTHRLCNIDAQGEVTYDPDFVGRNGQELALEQARQIAKETLTYMRQMEQAPPLTAEGLTGDYRLLAEFNDTVLAGHPTQFGMEFITWNRLRDQSLWQGHYYNTAVLADAYSAAKQDFATRSGLVSSGMLFTREQLAVLFDAAQNMTALGLVSNQEQEKLLEQIMEQIEEAAPQVIDLANELTQSPRQHEPGGMDGCI